MRFGVFGGSLSFSFSFFQWDDARQAKGRGGLELKGRYSIY